MNMTPFEPGKKQTSRLPQDSLLKTFFTLEEQIEQLDTEIRKKEEKLQALSRWRNSGICRQYQEEIHQLTHEKNLLEKTRQIVMKELMKEKEESE